MTFIRHFVALAILTVPAIAAVQSTPPAEPQVVMPPVECWFRGGETGMEVATPIDSSVMVLARPKTDHKKVTLVWNWYHQYPDLAQRKYVQQVFETRYWPTYAVGIAPNKLLVGGTRPAGNTVIELWTFANPQLDFVQHTISAGSRQSVATLTDEDIAGRRHVMAMVPMAGSSNKALIQFWDSKACWSLDLGSSAFALLAGPGPSEPPGVLVVPELDYPFKSINVANHQSHGYVYVFGDGRTFDAGDHPTVVLRDSNRDGVVDDYLAVDETGWEQQGLASPSNYLD